MLGFSIAPASAQDQDISMRFSHLTLEDGLSQSTVNEILQDSRGFLWFATEDGLNRYNGYEFKVFKNRPGNPNSISNNSISDVIEDENGNLWVGTKGGGLNKFDPVTEKFTRFKVDEQDSASLSTSYVTALFEDRSGVILVGTRMGLNIYQPSTGTFLKHQPEKNDNSLKGEWITAIFEDSQGMLWIGTQDNGLNRLDRTQDKFTHYANIPGDPQSLSDNWIVSIYEDKNNNLWIGTQSGGINKFDRETKTFERFQSDTEDRYSLSHNWVYTMFEDRYGEFWVGTLNGLNRFDREDNRFLNITALKGAPNLNNKSITALYEDRSGVFWVGTKDDALYKFVRSTQSFTVYDSNADSEISLSNNNVWAVKEMQNGHIWIGTHGGGINVVRPNKEGVSYYTHDPDDNTSLSDNFVNTIYQDRSGDIWVGTINGLCKYIPSTDSFKRFRHEPKNPNSISGNIVTTISQDKEGNIWIGTLNNGFSIYNKETGKFSISKSQSNEKAGLAHNKIWSVYEDDDDVLWVGTHGFGLAIYALNEKEYRYYAHDPNDDTSISSDFINVTYKDSEGRYWIGTLNGLNRFYPDTETFERFTTADGLPNNVIYGIVEDSRGHLWLSTNKGLCDFDPETGITRNYDAGDGLPSEEFRFSAFDKGMNGEIYFGSINGLVSFEPDSIETNENVPPVVFTNFEIYNKPVPIQDNSILEKSITTTDELTLSYNEKVFSFQFAGLHYAAPDQNAYAYKMEGFDEDWQQIGNRRFISFTSMPSGTYNLKVRAANKDGIWNNEGTQLKLNIEPPPWLSWWAYTIYVTFGLAVVGWFVSYRVEKERKEKEKIEEKREELEKLVGNRTRELQVEKEKSDQLLYNILPKEVADELKEKGKTTPRRFEEATILFSDFEEFTSTASSMSADRLVSELNEIFKKFDTIIEDYGIEKIKTIGDAYMAAGGIPSEEEDHALRCVAAACEMLNFVKERNKNSSFKWEMRVGMHSGSVVAGVVGQRKFTYDLWGDTVNLASRMENIGEVGKVNISARTHELVKEYFECEYRGKLDVTGRGKIDMYFVKGKKEGKAFDEMQSRLFNN
ncbi:MAG: two-component regulator propeller domain-containing protein [Balneolaceae bacterium]|nr:two-component regulator propeller domain-containing protein [Balneolaceae bacterium]